MWPIICIGAACYYMVRRNKKRESRVLPPTDLVFDTPQITTYAVGALPSRAVQEQMSRPDTLYRIHGSGGR